MRKKLVYLSCKQKIRQLELFSWEKIFHQCMQIHWQGIKKAEAGKIFQFNRTSKGKEVLKGSLSPPILSLYHRMVAHIVAYTHMS